MANYVGVDWASNGWVGAELDDDGELAIGFYPTVWNLWHDYDEGEIDQILVDIPIGLPEDERRECDREAQAELGGRAGSVFLTPIRDAVYEDNIEKAKAHHEERDAGYSVQSQVWGIVPRIREVDTFLREVEDATEIVRESHPELCFRNLTREALPSKSTEDGVEERKDALVERSPIAKSALKTEVDRLTTPGYFPRAAEDDVLDAVVLAVTANHVADGEYSTLPKDPPTDDEGLPMEIVCPNE